jgi:hypothetical protein
MSLTQFVGLAEVRQELAKHFAMPSLKTPQTIRVEPKTKSYSLIGTAFDYLFRFNLKKLNPSAVTKRWVAETALSFLPQDYDTDGLKKLSKKQGIPVDILKDFSDLKVTRQPGSLRVKVEGIINEAKEAYSEYLKSGIMTDELIRAAICLAQIDPIYRANYVDPNMGKVDDLVMQEMRELIGIVDNNRFIAKEHCLLNPTFGEASREVGGADADFILDGCIVDIKTTKYATFNREQFNQLIGYYTLHDIGGIDGNRDINITNMGIYFSRFGELVTFPVAPLIGKEYGSFVKWFRKTMKEIYAGD